MGAVSSRDTAGTATKAGFLLPVQRKMDSE